MRILALDLGKYKSVACDYEAESGRHRFSTILTNPKALHDLIVDREPDRVVIEICSIATPRITRRPAPRRNLTAVVSAVACMRLLGGAQLSRKPARD